MTIRQAAVMTYARRYDELAEAGQLLVACGEYDAAEEAFAASRLLVRAYEAEQFDPEVALEDPWCLCETCQSWLFAVRWQKLT